LSQEPIAPCDLEAFVHEAATRKQRSLEAFTVPFPKDPDRWLSHDPCKPRPLACTAAGAVEGGRSGLTGATRDLSCTRALFARDDSTEGGHGYDPARACCLEVASRVAGDPEDASVCAALRQQDTGHRSRAIAGLHAAIPGADELRHVRRRVGVEASEAALAVCVGLFRAFGLIRGARLATAGPLEPSHARFKGGASFCQACR